MTRFGAIALVPPVRGRWTFGGFPAQVTLSGAIYRRTPWAWPRSGVVAQYREARPVNSRHLFVLSDGTFVVPHVDEVNPDLGSALAHLARDVIKRPVRDDLRSHLPPL